VRLDPSALTESASAFLTERQLATLSTVRRDGSLHVVPVGFTFDQGTVTARVITSGGSVKARLASRAGAIGALCSVDGARWITLSGPLRVDAQPDVVADAVRRYAQRYRQPRVNPERIVIVMAVTAVSAARGLA